MGLNEVLPEPERTPSAGKPESYTRARILRLLKNTQRYSAYGIAAFAGLHLTSTVVLPAFSTEVANSAFMAARSVYQSEVGESVLVYGSIGIHILSGIALHAYRVYERYTNLGKISFKASSTAVSGLALTALVSTHFLTMRYSPVHSLGDSSLISLDYATHLLQNHRVATPASLLSLVALFAMHAISGAPQVFRIRRRSRLWSVVAAGFTALAAASLFALATQPRITGWVAGQYELAGSLLNISFS